MAIEKRMFPTNCQSSNIYTTLNPTQNGGLSTEWIIPIGCKTEKPNVKCEVLLKTNCVSLFLDTVQVWAEAEKKGKGGALPVYTVFFHNLKGFDGVLTMNTLYNHNLKVTDQMGTGTKILLFKQANLIFKDSLNFLNMALSAFPKTLELKELKKGVFPHKFFHAGTITL